MKSLHSLFAFLFLFMMCGLDSRGENLPFSDSPIILSKSAEKDFVILNLSDPQMSTDEWLCGTAHRKIIMRTLEELVERVRPDLITVSGDLSWAGHDPAYECLASYLDTFRIPWAPIWGNHDNQNGAEYIQALSKKMQRHPFCLLQTGDPELGCGNYIIRIQEGEKPVTALFMMDSHDREPVPGSTNPEEKWWSRLQANQIQWYSARAAELKAQGFVDSALILHIPIFAYRTAFQEAYAGAQPAKDVTWAQSQSPELWAEGYKDSLGVCHEGICSYGAEDDVMAALLQANFTKIVLCGHDHVNNFIIDYQGVKLCYSMKLGAGCYWEPALNGGTVITVGSQGIKGIRHEFVNVDDLVPVPEEK